MNKTIYVRDEDMDTWDRAKELAGDKLAPVIMDGLRRFVETKERETTGFERIEVHYRDAKSGGLPRAKAFYGKWLYPKENPYNWGNGSFDQVCGCYAIALTAKGRIAVLSWDEYNGESARQVFHVFDSIGDIEGNLPIEVVSAVMEKLGVDVEELDI